MSNHGEPMPHPAAGPTDRAHDEHRSIADAWLRSAIAGIRHMHLNEEARRAVAGRLF